MPKKTKALHQCPVCEHAVLTEPARSAKSGGGSYEICPGCGFQHGVDDDDKGITYAQARAKWLKAGAKWYSKTQRAPADWGKKEAVEKRR